MNSFKSLFGAIGFIILLSSCAATPHVFVNTYSPETLPEIDSIDGTNTVSGSAFLRQQGGGVVNCAGNKVVINQNLPYMERNAYAKEYLALSNRVRQVSDVDSNLIAFEGELNKLRNQKQKVTYCDVDGKFVFDGLAPGSYKVTTKVYWVVADAGQGGLVSANVRIPDGSDGKTTSIVVNTMSGYCSIFGCPAY